MKVNLTFWEPWSDQARRTFVESSPIATSLAFGDFTSSLYRRGGRVVEIEIEHSDGSRSSMSGAEFEGRAGWRAKAAVAS